MVVHHDQTLSTCLNERYVIAPQVKQNKRIGSERVLPSFRTRRGGAKISSLIVDR